MIRNTAVLLLITVILFTSSCTTITDSSSDVADEEPAEYTEDEFPGWLRDLRRAEIIFAGSIPFTILFTGMGYGLYNAVAGGIGDGYSIDDITDSGSRSDDERLTIMSISLGLSGVIAVTDFIIGLVEKADGEE